MYTLFKLKEATVVSFEQRMHNGRQSMSLKFSNKGLSTRLHGTNLENTDTSV